jgi:hypothetical protein
MKSIGPMLLALACVIASCRPSNGVPSHPVVQPDDAGIGPDNGRPICHDVSNCHRCTNECRLCTEASGGKCCHEIEQQPPAKGSCFCCFTDPN